ncbi:uncharacterized protein LOC122938453 [Bufo gargarizans]|uniref:uncharacterized protein LOC122938453 n=1 Tax=Bufo gargarizans TaxID=30331 RepID=UPI001CF218FB|nr:uncharacterized protein LOC122938453 [Bufo gargarizans]XP_044149905.1 uncharacterized protein LOC122938453 [Bufo gargarizans]XP_044149906.1 uncharacterized protein LOC122938453 [Bufo gargarizans]
MSAEQNKPLYVCEVCQVFCSSALHLSDHIGGSKHRNAIKGETPEFIANLQRLQYFIDHFLKDEPMIGLEYVVECLKNGAYSYSCLLCNTQTPRGTTILHLCGAKHRKAYLEKHHPELYSSMVRQQFSKKTEFTQQMKAIALQVERMYGRKNISIEADAQNEKEADANQSKVSSNLITEENSQLKGISHQISSERNSGIGRIIEKTEKSNRLEAFKTNNDFLDYLRTFEIKNDGDASFIQQITKNCTNALMKFREDQTKTQVSSTVTNNKKSFTSAQTPPIFQNTCEATEAFFNSIKNMNASEVVGILKQIAATNPAFRGINIPSLIKYLQETGRLKTS